LAILVYCFGQNSLQVSSVNLGLPYLVVVGGVGLDLLVLSSLAVFLAVVASTPSFVLIGTFGFMLVSRSYSAVIELLGSSYAVVGDAETYRAGVGVLGYLMPDLGSLDVRMVALYGRMEFLPADWSWLVVSSL